MRTGCSGNVTPLHPTPEYIPGTISITEYGALAARIDSVSYRLSAYLNGEIDSIPELEEERLSIDGKSEMPRAYNYLNTVTVSYVDPAQ